MEKSDLEVGDIIERVPGRLEMVYRSIEDGKLFVAWTGGYDYVIQVVNYNLNNIKSIRRPNRDYQFREDKWKEAPVIWTRQEPIKLKINGAIMEIDEPTKKDILNQLGVNHD